MSIATLVLGESGTGKSASMRNMLPDNTLLIQAVKKPLPFRANDWNYHGLNNPKGNIKVTDESAHIVKLMQKTKRDIIVIDDFQYIMANEFMRRYDEKGYDKFSEIGRHAWDILREASNLPDSKRVYILSHTQSDDYGNTKAKTIGKMLDDKITLEGLFTIVLRTAKHDKNYLFSTQNNGFDTVKSPMGLFGDDFIENDLAMIDSEICEYYNLTKEKAA